MTVRIDSSDGDYVIEDVEQEFVDNYNESYGKNLARILPSAWRLVSLALLMVFMMLLGIYLGNLLSQRKVDRLNAELIEAERESKARQDEAYQKIKMISRFVEELRMRTDNNPPFSGDGSPRSWAIYTMFKELNHLTKDIDNEPRHKTAMLDYYKLDAVERLYGE